MKSNLLVFFFFIYYIRMQQIMVEFFRSVLVHPIFLLGYLTKVSYLVLSNGREMLLITCSTLWMNFVPEVILILLSTTEIDHHSCLMLGHLSKGMTKLHFMMLRSLPCILNGGIWCALCYGTIQRGCCFLLLSSTGF